MDVVMPRAELEGLIARHYSKGEASREQVWMEIDMTSISAW